MYTYQLRQAAAFHDQDRVAGRVTGVRPGGRAAVARRTDGRKPGQVFRV
jgi:hypothetical protein